MKKPRFRVGDTVRVILEGEVWHEDFLGKVGVQVGRLCECGRFKVFFLPQGSPAIRLLKKSRRERGERRGRRLV